jgi:hypothetical protein
MGRALRPEHLGFFHARMNEHDIVQSCVPVSSKTDFLFEIRRTRGPPSVTVHLSDAYRYGEIAYIARPREIGKGDFVVIAMPHAWDPEFSVLDLARAERIGIGKIGKFMAALRHRNVWEYQSPDENSMRALSDRKGNQR